MSSSFARVSSSEPYLPPEAKKTTPFPCAGQGFTFMELMAATLILLLLSSIALPWMQLQWTRSRESELRYDLREMREAIDRYKRFADLGYVPPKADTSGYPPDLETLVEGVPTRLNGDLKLKFLRRIPIDPMTGTKDWGLRSMQDDPDSRSWGGQNVFDVYTKSEKKAIDGSRYSDW